MKTHAFRLKPGDDLRKEIVKLTSHIKAGIVLSAAGSLSRATIRMADVRITKEFEGPFEIVSLTGTLSRDGPHLHISISDANGTTIGGHLKGGSTVYTTAEIVIGELEDTRFTRVPDKQTGYCELNID